MGIAMNRFWIISDSTILFCFMASQSTIVNKCQFTIILKDCDYIYIYIYNIQVHIFNML